jgi:hypothetical protein
LKRPSLKNPNRTEDTGSTSEAPHSQGGCFTARNEINSLPLDLVLRLLRSFFAAAFRAPLSGELLVLQMLFCDGPWVARIG